MLLIVFFVFNDYAKAQQLIFFKPENLKQLPSSVTYNVMQDSKGYIWFSTEGGLCRYDGDNIKVFDADNGLPEAATYGIKEDDRENIWLTTSKYRILKYSNGKIQELPFTRQLTDTFAKHYYVITEMELVNDSTLLASSLRNVTYLINLHSNTVRRWKPRLTDCNFNFEIFPNGAFAMYYSLEHNAVENAVKAGQLTVNLLRGNKHVRFSFSYKSAYFPFWRCYTQQGKNNELFIGIDNVLVKVNADMTQQIYRLPNTILDMKIDKDNGLWIGLFNDGLRYYPECNIGRGISSLRGLSVSGVCEDKEGGIWCTTLEKGIFYCRNKSIVDYSNNDNLKQISMLKYLDGHLFATSKKDELLEIRKDSVLKYRILPANMQYLDIIKRGKRWLLCSNNSIVSTNSNFSEMFLIHKNAYSKKTNSSARMLSGNDKSAYGVSFGDVIEIGERIGRTIVRLSYAHVSGGRCILLTREEELLAGCGEGLYTIKDSVVHKIKGTEADVSKLIQARDGTVWVATKDAGIFLYKDKQLTRLRTATPLKTKRFVDITEDKAGNIWCASNIGLIKITRVKKDFVCTHYNISTGLPINEIFKVAATDSALFFSTPEGLCSFPLPEKLLNTTLPLISILVINVNDKIIPFTGEDMQFKYYENNLKIKPEVFTYKRAGATPQVIYVIKGPAPDYQSVVSSELTLNSLSPGKYHVAVYTINSDYKLSLPIYINLEIRKPFWQTTIFIIALITLFLLMVYIVTRTIIRKIRTGEKEKTRVNKMLANYHMSALRAQMNPHFIFNCINSIQRFILTNKPREAYNYLTKFSKLIRLVLNYAEKNLITLKQELEIVELYLGLEQRRFDNKFTYAINVEPGLETEKLHVPVLIIQPYVENAIWHGIMNLEKEKRGHINLMIGLRKNILEIVIEDNGVGREKAARFSKKAHESKAILINQQRTEILNKAGTPIKPISAEDITGENGNIEGTRITIRIVQTKTADNE